MYQMLCTGQMNEAGELTIGFSNVNSLMAFTRAVSMAQGGDSLIGMDSKESSRGESGMSPLKTTFDKFLYEREQRGGEETGGRAESKKVLLF